MRLLFIAPGLSPGADGVGDYTRTLAASVAAKGHACSLLALNEPQIHESVTEEAQAPLPALRLARAQPWPERWRAAESWINRMNPDVVSVQYVGYGFHPRGFSSAITSPLAQLIGSRQRQMMMHELWIGFYPGAPVRERLIGWWQRATLRRLWARLSPGPLHTSNDTYVRLIQSAGFQAIRLPLFGSIPITEGNGDSWLWPLLQTAGCNVDANTRGRFWLFAHFGTLHPVWPPEPLLGRIAKVAEQAGRKPVFLAVGRLGHGESHWDNIAAQNQNRFHFIKLGPRSTTEVSQCFQSADFGLAASPLSLIGKSSSVSAMLEHGLPVIVNREDGLPPGPEINTDPRWSNLIRLDSQFESKLLRPSPRKTTSYLPGVTDQFLANLADAPSSAG